MNEERVDELLRSSPREMASDGFTKRVVASLDARSRNSLRRRKRIWRLSAAVLVSAVLILSAALWNQEANKEQMRAQLAVLQREARELREGLQTWKQQRWQSRPMIYLGGNREVDFVLDLNRYRQDHPGRFDTATIPTSYRGGSI
jgi:hypothetical protein